MAEDTPWGSIPDGMTLWLDAADDASFTLRGGSGRVVEWRDRSAQGVAFTQSSNNLRPSRELEASPTNLPLVRFEERNRNQREHIHSTSQVALDSLLSSEGSSVFVVIEQASSAEERFIINAPFNSMPMSMSVVSGGGGSFSLDGINVNHYAVPDNYLHIVAGHLSDNVFGVPLLSVYSTISASSGMMWPGFPAIGSSISGSSGDSAFLTLGAENDLGANPFDGYIAEVLIYNVDLSFEQRMDVYSYLHRKWFTGERNAASANVSGSVDALSCRPHQILLSVVDADGVIDNSYVGRVTLATGSASVNWSVVEGAADSLTEIAGQWGYNFNGEGSVTLAIDYQQAGEVSVEAMATDNQPFLFGPIQFRPSGLLASVNSISQIAGKPFNITLTAVTESETGDGSLICETLTDYNDTGTQAWFNHLLPGTPAGTPSLNSSLGRFGLGQENARELSSSFVSGSATISNVTFNDAGMLAIAFKDDSIGIPGIDGDELVGGLEILFNPLALVIDNVSGAAVNASPSGLTAAGDPFSFRVKAVAYESENDTDLTDNAITPSFAADVDLAPQVDSTAGYRAGLLSNSRVTADRFNAGVASLADFTSYSEVGSMQLSLSADWLQAGNRVSGLSGDIGRFYPARFEVVGSTIVDNGNSTQINDCADHTYMDDRAITLDFRVQAQNRAGLVTQNYDESIGYPVGLLDVVAQEQSSNADLSNRICTPSGGGCSVPAFPGRWESGSWRFNETDLFFSKAANLDGDIIPDGPYSQLQLGLRIDDSDAAQFDSLNLLGNSAHSIGSPLNIRYGRLKGESAYGPENQPLILALITQYYSGSRFESADDSCSQLASAQLTFAENSAGELNNIRLLDASGASSDAGIANSIAAQGEWRIQLSAPGDEGRIPLQMDLGNYPDANSLHFLMHDWDGDGDLDNPPDVEASWGRYRGNDRIIYWRENH